jgi:hypothetical protein
VTRDPCNKIGVYEYFKLSSNIMKRGTKGKLGNVGVTGIFPAGGCAAITFPYKTELKPLKTLFTVSP